MPFKLERIQTFIMVIDLHSFSVAAKKLKVSPAAVSKQIGELERDLKALLIERTTRRLSLTEAGRIYYEQCRRLLEEVKETEAIASKLNAEPSGTLRVFAARHIGLRAIVANLKSFLELYPKVRVDLELGERMPDPSREDLDLIFGVSVAGPDLWIQKKIGETRYVLCASPEYLAQRGTPEKPSDLVHHQTIIHKMRKPENQIEFKVGEGIEITPLLKFNDTEAMLECTLKGFGIAHFHEYVVKNLIQEGKLVEVLASFGKPKAALFLYYPPRRFLQSKVRIFIEYFGSRVE